MQERRSSSNPGVSEPSNRAVIARAPASIKDKSRDDRRVSQRARTLEQLNALAVELVRSVDHEQRSLFDVQSAVDQVRQQRVGDGRVLGRPSQR